MADVAPGRFTSRLIQIAWIIGVFLLLLTLPNHLIHVLGLSKRIESMAQAPFSRQMLFAGLYLVHQALSLAVCVVLVVVLYRRTLGCALGELGLNGDFKLGWLIGLAATLPMPVIFSIMGRASFSADVVLEVLVFGIGSGIAAGISARRFCTSGRSNQPTRPPPQVRSAEPNLQQRGSASRAAGRYRGRTTRLEILVFHDFADRGQ
jgi:hypothetical protein